MTFDDYQKRALLTAVYPRQYAVTYPALGLAGEAGEVANKIAKVFRDQDGDFAEADKLAVLDECGDVLWQTAALLSDLGLSLADAAAHNLTKLAGRQARGTLTGSGDDR